nr:ABC transporter ATP-binding protein [Anaerococcus tetradius]
MYIFMCFISASLTAGTAFLYQRITSSAINNDFRALILFSIFAIPYLILEASFDYIPKKYRSIITNRISLDLKNDLIKNINETELSKMDYNFTNTIKNKMVNDLSIVEESYIRNLLSIILYSFMFVISLISAIYIQGYLTIIMLVLSAIPLLTPIISKKILANKKELQKNAKDKYLNSYNEYADNILFVNISNLKLFFHDRLKLLGEKLKHESIFFESSLLKTYSISYGLGNVLYSGTWIIGGIFVYKNLLTLPSLIAMTTLMFTIAGPIQTISNIYSEFLSSRKIFFDYLDFIDKCKTNDKKTNSKISNIEKIDIKNLNLSFSNKIILKNISFNFMNGNKYVLLGESGSGKSTFLNSLFGIYEYANDYIAINEKKLSEIDKSSYYDNMFYIPQETIIFNTSILNNITLFSENVDLVRSQECIEKVGLSDWFNSKDNEFDCVLSKDSISGGEKKRLDLARALYLDKSVIIMDEPTSALDFENEILISKIIKGIQDKLIICVSHSTNGEFLNVFDKKIKIINKEFVIENH